MGGLRRLQKKAPQCTEIETTLHTQMKQKQKSQPNITSVVAVVLHGLNLKVLGVRAGRGVVNMGTEA